MTLSSLGCMGQAPPIAPWTHMHVVTMMGLHLGTLFADLSTDINSHNAGPLKSTIKLKHEWGFSFCPPELPKHFATSPRKGPYLVACLLTDSGWSLYFYWRSWLVHHHSVVSDGILLLRPPSGKKEPSTRACERYCVGPASFGLLGIGSFAGAELA